MKYLIFALLLLVALPVSAQTKTDKGIQFASTLYVVGSALDITTTAIALHHPELQLGESNRLFGGWMNQHPNGAVPLMIGIDTVNYLLWREIGKGNKTIGIIGYLALGFLKCSAGIYNGNMIAGVAGQ